VRPYQWGQFTERRRLCGGGVSGIGQAAGSPCQSQLEESGEVLREVKAEIQHSTNGLVLEPNWRKDGWHLLMNVISKTTKFVLSVEKRVRKLRLTFL
jgi:hypothetical protein